MAYAQWRMDNGVWTMAYAQWRMDNGICTMAYGQQHMDKEQIDALDTKTVARDTHHTHTPNQTNNPSTIPHGTIMHVYAPTGVARMAILAQLAAGNKLETRWTTTGCLGAQAVPAQMQRRQPRPIWPRETRWKRERNPIWCTGGQHPRDSQQIRTDRPRPTGNPHKPARTAITFSALRIIFPEDSPPTKIYIQITKGAFAVF